MSSGLKSILALSRDEVLCCPTPGVWIPCVQEGASVRPDRVLGWVEQLGRRLELRAPARVRGQALEILPPWSEVEHGSELLRMGVSEQDELSEAETEAELQGVILRAPMDGSVYLRPAPDQPAFAPEGSRVRPKQVIALMEVMKTFTPLLAPEKGILHWVIEDGDSLEGGSPFAWLDPETEE